MYTRVGFCLRAVGLGADHFSGPRLPPRAHSIQVKFIADTSRLEGTETIRFRNESRQPIGRMALDWFGDVLRMRPGSIVVERPHG